MKKNLFALIACSLVSAITTAQPPKPGPKDFGGEDRWEVSINKMDGAMQEKMTQAVEELQSRGGATRSVLSDLSLSVLSGTSAAMIDVVTTEIINLAKYRREQKRKWYQMIERECNYTDSISSIKGLKDFYSDVSTLGALDPSGINFNGFTIRGMRDGQEVLYMSCSIDTCNLRHIFQHSKFNLVLDTLIFHPYACHLPNLQANGIRLMRADRSERDNSFSFDERQNLCIGLDMTLSSSWINEAIMVMDNVELGHFSLNVRIDSSAPVFVYSRRQINLNRANGSQTDTTYIPVEGESFVVPRSYVPVSGGKRMWGTGEYNVKVLMRESCQFVNDEDRNQKMKRWYKDYRQLRKMQKRGSQVGEYLKSVWQQNGNTLVKQAIKQGLTTSVQQAGIVQGGANMGAAMGQKPSAAGNMPMGGKTAPM